MTKEPQSHALPLLRTSPPPPAAPSDQHADTNALYDSHGRRIRDLRLSVTDRCNFRCVYCMDPDFRYMPKTALLEPAEYEKLARIAHRLGIEKLRLTGGEPTLYAPLDDLLERLGRIGFREIAMTTNGSLMAEGRARKWRDMGLTRMTFSLDSLRDDRIQKLTRTKQTLDDTLRAIDAARNAGLLPIKINAVVMRGINDDECADFATFARTHDVNVRFIEWMPLDSGGTWGRDRMVPASEILASIKQCHDVEKINADQPDSTSMNYRFADGAPGTVGIIASVTHPFCGQCSRLRITADGKIRPCLFSHNEWDIRTLVRHKASDKELAAFFINAVWAKQAGHNINSEDFVQPDRPMSSIGG